MQTTASAQQDQALEGSQDNAAGSASDTAIRTAFASGTYPLFWTATEGLEMIGLPAGTHAHVVPADRHILDIALEGETKYFAENAEAPQTCPPRSFSLLTLGQKRTLQTERSGHSLRLAFTDEFVTNAGLTNDILQQPIKHRSDSALLGAAHISFEHLRHRNQDATLVELSALALTLLARLTHFKPRSVNARSAHPSIDRAITYIEENLGDPLRIDEVSRRSGMSPYHFCRIFRSAMNVSPHQYITQRRVEHARQLIQTTEGSLAEIAFQAGFGSQSHMTTTFKRMVDKTPGQLRREIRSLDVSA